MMVVLSLRTSSSDDEVTVTSKPVIHPVNLDAEGNPIPPPLVHEGDAPQASVPSVELLRLIMRLRT